MSELLVASLRFPTVVFTIALGIALVYWGSVLLGALDLDLLGGGHADGVGDAVGGHDVGGDAAGHDAGDGGDADGGDGGGGIWHGLGLGTVPMTISISFILLVGWCASLLAMTYIVGDSGILKAAVLPASLIVAFPVAALLVKPLAPVFRIAEGKSNSDYVGHTCVVTSNTVDHTFGYATIMDGGSHVQIAVRCDKTPALKRGDKALVIEFDAEKRTFLVEPDLLADKDKAHG